MEIILTFFSFYFIVKRSLAIGVTSLPEHFGLASADSRSHSGVMGFTRKLGRYLVLGINVVNTFKASSVIKNASTARSTAMKAEVKKTPKA